MASGDLEKIHRVMELKRARAERIIAELKGKVQSIENAIAAEKTRNANLSRNAFAGKLSDNVPADLVHLAKWQEKVRQDMAELEAQKDQLTQALTHVQGELKAILVQGDIVQKQMLTADRLAQEEYQDTQSSTRLENWVTANRM